MIQGFTWLRSYFASEFNAGPADVGRGRMTNTDCIFGIEVEVEQSVGKSFGASNAWVQAAVLVKT